MDKSLTVQWPDGDQTELPTLWLLDNWQPWGESSAQQAGFWTNRASTFAGRLF